MDYKFIKYTDGVYVKNLNDISYIEIKYIGSLIADIEHNTYATVKDNVIKIYFRETAQNELLMKYKGNFKIIDLKARNKKNRLIKLTTEYINDEIKNIKSKWNGNEMRYTDYNKHSNTGTGTSLISYTFNGKKMYKNTRNKKIIESRLPKNHYKKLNSIRS